MRNAIRWPPAEPGNWCWSSFVLGRIDTRAKFNAMESVTLSAYRNAVGDLRYTIANPRTRPRKTVLYRINVIKKVK